MLHLAIRHGTGPRASDTGGDTDSHYLRTRLCPSTSLMQAPGFPREHRKHRGSCQGQGSSFSEPPAQSWSMSPQTPSEEEAVPSVESQNSLC